MISLGQEDGEQTTRVSRGRPGTENMPLGRLVEGRDVVHPRTSDRGQVCQAGIQMDRDAMVPICVQVS